MKLPALVDVTCKQMTEWFGDYLADRGLGASDRARFEQHLHACTWCMDYLDQLQEARRVSRGLARDEGAIPEAALLAMYRRLATTAHTSRPAAEPVAVKPAERAPPPRFAFKFLRADGSAPISRFVWPRPHVGEPGAWVTCARVEPCRAGVHACAATDLSRWLHDTLWLVELDGAARRTSHAVVAARGRLLYEIEAWRHGGAMRFAEAAHAHASALVESADAERREAARPCVTASAAHLPNRNYALAAFCAAMASARLRGIDHFVQSGYDAERRWQSAWLRRELGLDAALANALAQGCP